GNNYLGDHDLCFNYNTILSLFSHVNTVFGFMTLILKKITKLFEPSYNNLDAKLWVQKIVLKKYLKKN
ncbi:MAG: hypothetical protein QF795_06210, partial [Candidatus Marinimicrobia bacterium]|nr:hypothetical protein [Candidatus Neomarinimicrobiota bacterium]